MPKSVPDFKDASTINLNGLLYLYIS